jgi:lipoprotein-releasing system permease protein
MLSGLTTWVARKLMKGGSQGMAGPAVKVATAAVAMGVAIMIVSIAVGTGFKREIRNKIVGFGGHLQIASLDLNSSMETKPLSCDTALLNEIAGIDGVESVETFATKPGIIKTDEAFLGVALKGVSEGYDWRFISDNLTEGSTLSITDSAKTDGIVLGEVVCKQLGLKLGDAVRVFFVGDGVRARKFTLEGIYNTHLEEYDKQIALVDSRHVVALNNWKMGQVSGYEVKLKDFERVDDIAQDVVSMTTVRLSQEDEMMRVRTIKDLQPQIFGWLALLDKNIVVILVLISAVAGLNMISGLLILILEHTNSIGIMKAIGMNNSKLRAVFVKIALRIVTKGLSIGCISGIGLCICQKLFNVVKLDPENYYLDSVPIDIVWWHVAAVCIGTLLVSVLMLVGPSGMVASISPTKSIKFR